MSSIEEFLQRTRDRDITLADTTPNSIAMSTRIRLARNVADYRFPKWLTEQEELEIERQVRHALMDTYQELNHFALSDIAPLARHVLVEKHLISPHFMKQKSGDLLVSEDETMSIMVNEEDHLRIQCLATGLQLQETYERASTVDQVLEQQVTYAFDEKLGYLTSCPTNVGTGLRASVMLHLPALTMTNRMNIIAQTMLRLGIVVRGIYGEGSNSLGNIYQVSNQVTLGKSEVTILTELQEVVEKVIESELQARQALVKNSALMMEDQVYRALGVLTHARILTSDEAATNLSRLRLGIDMKLIDLPIKAVNQCISCMQPGFLQYYDGQTLPANDRDILRAKLVRETLQQAI